MYQHVQLVTILRNLGFLRSAHDIHRIHMYIHLIALYDMSTPLETRFPQDRDQWYKSVHSLMNQFMSVYSGTVL